MLTGFKRLAAGGGFAAWLSSGAALAADGQPRDWQLGLQPPATPLAHQLDGFHDFLNIIIIAITLFVLGLLIYVMVRFNERSNPEPSATSHNTMLEVAWTVVPVIILAVIVVPSFRLLSAQYDVP